MSEPARIGDPCRFILWLAEGEPECGEPSVALSALGNPCCERHARKCRHRRQTWWGVALPCAEPSCREGFSGPTLTMPVPFERPSFNAATTVLVERAQFERNEWKDPATGATWQEWNQTVGPTPPATARTDFGRRLP